MPADRVFLRKAAERIHDVPGFKEQFVPVTAEELLDLLDTIAMYESAIEDEFGPGVLERFGPPPDGWRKQVG